MKMLVVSSMGFSLSLKGSPPKSGQLYLIIPAALPIPALWKCELSLCRHCRELLLAKFLGEKLRKVGKKCRNIPHRGSSHAKNREHE